MGGETTVEISRQLQRMWPSEVCDVKPFRTSMLIMEMKSLDLHGGDSQGGHVGSQPLHGAFLSMLHGH